jgi:hypothetical protein
MSNRRAVISGLEGRQGSEGVEGYSGENDWDAAERSVDKVIIRRETLAQQATMWGRLNRHYPSMTA